MVGCQLGLGRMAHHIPCYLQHYNTNPASGALLSTVQSTALALAKTDASVSDCFRWRNTVRLGRISILRARASNLDTGLRGGSGSVSLGCKTRTKTRPRPSRTQDILAKAGSFGLLSSPSLLLPVLQRDNRGPG